MEATSARELIDWKSEKVYEPVFTIKMSIEDIKQLVTTPLQIPPFSLHTQSCERAVQEVSKASNEVCEDQERRVGSRQGSAERGSASVWIKKGHNGC